MNKLLAPINLCYKVMIFPDAYTIIKITDDTGFSLDTYNWRYCYYE